MVKEYCRPGYRAVTAGFAVNGSAAFLDFLKRAFDARDVGIDRNKDGSIGHGEIQIGDSLLEICEAKPAWPAQPSSVHLYVADTDAWYARAVGAGAISVTMPEDAPYGDRAATVRDPADNQWFIATRLEGSPIPEGFHSVTPYVITSSADAVMAFVKATFGATERVRVPANEEDGKVMHAELQIDDSVVEFSDGSPAWPPRPCQLHLYVPDADAAYRRALTAGATSVYAPTDQPYGDRECGVLDAGGNYWFIGTHQGS
jgi:PhnB protein